MTLELWNEMSYTERTLQALKKTPKHRDELAVKFAQLTQKITHGLSEVHVNWDTSLNQQDIDIFFPKENHITEKIPSMLQSHNQ